MYSIIVNPLSGGGLAARCLPEIESLLSGRGISSRVDTTVRAGDARRLAAQAVADGLDGVIAVGGDGTFFEVVNGIGVSGCEVIFAPCGTGNDFLRMFSLPKQTVEAVKAQLDAPERAIDLCRCNEKYFLNVAGTGFDVNVLIEAERFKPKYGGLKAYLLGAYNAIRHFKPFEADISIDGGEWEKTKASIISIGNGSYIGGGMNAVPGAKVDDGLFDVVLCNPVSKISIYVLLIYFVMGKHVNHSWLSRVMKCKAIHIKCAGMTIEADGEMFPCDDAAFEILPGALNTRLPQ